MELNKLAGGRHLVTMDTSETFRQNISWKHLNFNQVSHHKSIRWSVISLYEMTIIRMICCFILCFIVYFIVSQFSLLTSFGRCSVFLCMAAMLAGKYSRQHRAEWSVNMNVVKKNKQVKGSTGRGTLTPKTEATASAKTRFWYEKSDTDDKTFLCKNTQQLILQNRLKLY